MIRVDVLEKSAKGLQPFIRLPFGLYKGDRNYVPPDKKRLTAALLSAGETWMGGAQVRFYLAYRGDTPIARAMAGYDASDGNPLGCGAAFLSLFEAGDGDGAQAVLDAASAFLKKAGAQRVAGPLYPGYSVLTRGILLEGEGAPVLENAYNPPAYASYFERAGYEKKTDYLAFNIAVDEVPLDRLTALADQVRQRFGFEVRALPFKEVTLHTARDIAMVLQSAMAGEYDMLPSEEDILALFHTMKPIYRGELCVMAYAGAAPIGVLLCFPDNSGYLRALKGGQNPLLQIKARLMQGAVRRVRCPMQAVVPAYQNKAVNLAMICQAMNAARQLKVTHVEGSLVAEDHASAVNNTRLVGGKVYRTYRLYQKVL